MRPLLIDQALWFRFVAVLKGLIASEVGGKAITSFVLLVVLLLGMNGANVVSSYIGRDFMTAIANRDMTGFTWQATLYIGVFLLSTVIAVFCRFTEERLGLLWRKWQTQQLILRYLKGQTYYRLKESGRIGNLDERIADDVRTLTSTTLSFLLMILNGIIAVAAFSGVLWSISPQLFAIAIAYATCGTAISIALGRQLVDLDSNQIDKEANLRATLIHVRENAEPIALSHQEGRLISVLSRRLEELTDNFRKIITINRNLGFFTTGYNYLVLIIPALVIAPLFIQGQVEFGVIAQSAIAFAQLVGAFSLIVSQFQSISSFTAVVARLDSLWEGIEDANMAQPAAIEVIERDGEVIFEEVTAWSPEGGAPLFKELSLSIPRGVRTWVTGANEEALLALFKATAGVWKHGEGRITRPGVDHLFFLAERPYLPPGSLRDALVQDVKQDQPSDDQIIGVLHELHLEPVLQRIGGLDAVRDDWTNILSLGEQQLLKVCSLVLNSPDFAFLDRPDTALNPTQISQILTLLSQRSITFVNFGNTHGINKKHIDAVLELTGNGGWHWGPQQTERLGGDST